MSHEEGFCLRVLLLNTKDGEPSNLNSYMTLGLAEGFRHWLGRESVVITGYKHLVETAQKFQPSALICYDGENARMDVLLETKKIGVAIACWLTEDPFELEYNLKNQLLYDHVFTNEESAVSSYKPGHATFLPMAASKVFCHFPVNPSPKHDVCIAGTAWPERVEFCRTLKKLMPELRWKIILTKIPHVPDFVPPAPEIETNLRLSIRDLCRTFNDSKMVVTLRRQYSHRKIRLGLSPPPRIFETALAGTAQLVQTVNGDCIGNYFEIGKEIETFSTAEECAQKISSLIQHPEKRSQMAQLAQERALNEHLFDNRIKTIIEWIGRQPSERSLPPPRKRVLIWVHSSSRSKAFGGTEVWTEDLVNYLKKHWQVFLLHPHEDERGFFWRLVDVNRGVWEDEPINAVDQACNVSPEYNLRLKRIILKNEIELVHFQHLIYLPLLISRAVRELGIPYTISAPDYYPICHKFTLVDKNGRYCHPDTIPLETCDICLRATHGYLPGSQANRRRLVKEVLEGTTAVICVSKFQRQLMLQIYPELENTIRVVQPTAPPGPDSARRGNNDTLRVVIPSNFTFFKGADVALDILRFFRNDPRLEFRILGRIDLEYQEALSKLSGPNIRVIGGYSPADRLNVFRDADLALFLSIWPEGYPLTFEELRRMKVPTIVSGTGEVSSLVENGITGWKVPPHDAGAVVSLLNSILEERSVLDSVRDNLGRLSLREHGEDFHEMDVILDKALSARKSHLNDRALIAKQLEWITEQLAIAGTAHTLWALLPPPPPEQPPSIVRFPTPREAVGRFLFYAKRDGLLKAVRSLFEWLST